MSRVNSITSRRRKYAPYPYDYRSYWISENVRVTMTGSEPPNIETVSLLNQLVAIAAKELSNYQPKQPHDDI